MQLRLLKQWNIPMKNSGQMISLQGIEADDERGAIYLLDASSKSLITIDSNSDKTDMVPLGDMQHASDLTLNGEGLLAFCVYRGFSTLDRTFLMQQILGAGDLTPRRIAATNDSGYILSFQGAASKYSISGELLWRCFFPTQCMNLIPVSIGEQNYIVGTTSQLIVFQLDNSGSVVSLRTIAPIDDIPKLGRAPDGKNILVMPLMLIDAVKGSDAGALLLLYNHESAMGNKQVLLYYKYGDAPLAFDLPNRLIRLRLFGNNQIVGYSPDMSTRQYSVYLLAAPDWSQGTPLNEI